MSSTSHWQLRLRAEMLARIRTGGARDVIDTLQALATEGEANPVLEHIEAIAWAFLGSPKRAEAIWASLYERGFWNSDMVYEWASILLSTSQVPEAEALLREWHEAGDAETTHKLRLLWLDALLASDLPDRLERAEVLVSEDLKSGVAGYGLQRQRVWIHQRRWTHLAGSLNADQSLPQLAQTLRRDGQLSEAIALMRHVLKQNPEDSGHYTALSELLEEQGDVDRAMDTLADGYERLGNDPVLLQAIIQTCLRDRDFAHAAAWVNVLETSGTVDQKSLQSFAVEVMIGLGDLQGAWTLLSQPGAEKDELDPGRVAYYARVNLPERALHYQARCLERSIRSPDALLASARLASAAGTADAAKSYVREAYEKAPGRLDVLAQLLANEPDQVTLQQLARLRQALRAAGLPARRKAWLAHCLADYHRSNGDHDLAGDLYEQSNQLSEPPAAERYQSRQHSAWLAELREAFAHRSVDPPPETLRGPVPVFVVGVPRSGTTLTEQILSRHPQATGMGECGHVALSLSWCRTIHAKAGTTLPLGEALQRLTDQDRMALRKKFLGLLEPHGPDHTTPAGHRFVDKMPDNYSLIGWIFMLFPEARVIYAKRDPREIALSCWKANFGSIEWAYRMKDIAERIIEHYRMMRFWLDRFGDRIFVSHYADLVQRPQDQSRALVAAMGLPWDRRCADHRKARSIVRTASERQVRNPIYTSSLGSWVAYETHLAPAVRRFRQAGLLDDEA